MMYTYIRFFILLFSVTLMLGSCNIRKYQTREGERIVSHKVKSFPDRTTNYTDWHKKIVYDVDSNYLISKTRSKVEGGCFHFEIVRSRTITYSKEGKRMSKEVIRKNVTVKSKTY